LHTLVKIRSLFNFQKRKVLGKQSKSETLLEIRYIFIFCCTLLHTLVKIRSLFNFQKRKVLGKLIKSETLLEIRYVVDSEKLLYS
jgi:hypothetical protein